MTKLMSAMPALTAVVLAAFVGYIGAWYTGAIEGNFALVALSSALLKKSVRGGLVVVGEVTLGGTIEPVHNAVTLAEIAVEKGAKSLLLPVSCRRQLFDLSDEMATKLDVEFYQDGRDALLKALVD